MVLAALVILWVSALASGVLSNVPFTIAMVPLLRGLAAQGILSDPLRWALALGVGFGGNLTPIGATANVFVISTADSMGEPITFKEWIRSGSTIAVVACAVASVALFIAIRLEFL